jgi:antitoxin component YwqK of YwqJK toxin-antitoxin module
MAAARRLVLPSLVVLFLAACGRNEELVVVQQIDVTNDGRILAVDLIDPAALPTGSIKRELLNDQGRLQFRGWICDDKPVGPCVYYHPNGVPAQLGSYRYGGRKDGEWYAYYPSGHLQSIANYDGDTLHGAYEDYHDNGRQHNLGRYYRGQRSCSWQTFYDNGQLMNIGGYRDGQPFGLWVHFTADGTLVNRTNYNQPGNTAPTE